MKVETKTTITMDDREFDDLVHEHYPLRENYGIVPDELMSNGDTWTSDLTANTGDEITAMAKWAAHGWDHCGIGPAEICQDLIRKGVFPAGCVIINAFW
jgi:hypothetical protein